MNPPQQGSGSQGGDRGGKDQTATAERTTRTRGSLRSSARALIEVCAKQPDSVGVMVRQILAASSLIRQSQRAFLAGKGWVGMKIFIGFVVVVACIIWLLRKQSSGVSGKPTGSTRKSMALPNGQTLTMSKRWAAYERHPSRIYQNGERAGTA